MKKQTDNENVLRAFLIRLLISFLLLSAVYTALLPSIFDLYATLRQQLVIRSYNIENDELDIEKKNELLKEAEVYNQKLYEEYKGNLFFYSGDGEQDEEYQKQLGEVRDDPVIGYLELTEISVQLPIIRGTTTEGLNNAAGHMYKTSLPVGGENTHSVIAAHTGLSTAKLFSDLDKVKEGDTFSIYVLGRTLVYKVCEIRVVLPEEEYHYLQIEEGKDYVTLYTCTPYGINDHRLLVKGERISNLEEACEMKSMEYEGSTDGKGLISEEISAPLLTKLLILLFIPLFFWILYIIYLCYTSIWIFRNKKHEIDSN